MDDCLRHYYNLGVCFTVKDLVTSSVADQLEWPHRIVLPVGDTPANIIRWVLLGRSLVLRKS